MLYSIDGLTSLQKANCLKCNVTEYITLQNDLISFNTEACADLIKHMPYHFYITLSDDAFTEDTIVADDDSDEYIVEEVINTRFNVKEGRFEYQVKWKGYSHIYNTWELDSNIPSDMFNKFKEEGLSGQKTAAPTAGREGLRSRSSRKTTFQSDYNMKV